MADIKYTKEHEYIRIENGIGTVGITHYAQDKLGDITYVEVPAVGKVLKAQESTGVVESVKAASEVYSPVSGEVIEANEDLVNKPELVNEDPENAAWFFKIKIANNEELAGLMDRAAYDAYLEGQH